MNADTSMPNENIIQRLRVLLDEAELTAFANGSFERSVEFHMEALEGIDLAIVHQARHLAFRLAQSHYLDGEVEFGSTEAAADVRREFHKLLDDLHHPQ